DEGRRRTDRLGDLPRGFRDVPEHERRSLLRERPGGGPADPRARTRHDDDLALHTPHASASYAPRNRGSRFSTKAAIPSSASRVARNAESAACSRSSPVSRSISWAVRMSARILTPASGAIRAIAPAL